VKVLVVYCHPLDDSFAASLRERALIGLRSAGHQVRLTDLYADDFDPALSAWEHLHHLDPPDTKPDIARYVDDLRWCEGLVLVYPTWWSTQPAMLKGWFDRVWVQGVAYHLPEGTKRIRPGLAQIRRIVVVTTHGSSKLVNALQGEGGKRVALRALRVLANKRTRTRWIALYAIDRTSQHQRTKFLERVQHDLSRL
jgi:putative NADPH-quinone reductase